MDFDKIIDALAKRAEASIGTSIEDYVKDGLLYCGNCNTKKQVKISVGGNERIVFCLCECERQKQNQEEQEEKERRRLIDIKILKTQGISDKSIRDYSFSNADETPNIQKCKKYVEKWKDMYLNNNGLLFWGKPGCGKTYAAGCIANALIENRIPVLVTSFPRILNAGYDKLEVLKSMRDYDLVIIDDLGVERTSEYALETVYMIIDERYKANKPMIITTNLKYQDIQNPKNIEFARIYDRILGVCVPVLFGEESRRVKQGEDKMKFAKEIFGG